MSKTVRGDWKNRLILLGLIFALCAVLTYGKYGGPASEPSVPSSVLSDGAAISYSGEPYIVLDGNVPRFSPDQYETREYAVYGALDDLGRSSACIACLGREMMPAGEREPLTSVTPTGWQNQRYSFIEQEYLYNRCHLIGWQLSGENANPQNLFTGTRYLNVEGMLPFENRVADYLRRTGNHVLYRVTPVFSGDELLAQGVRLEAYSVEDGGQGIRFHVFCFNVQPGVILDYATGNSRAEHPETVSEQEQVTYIVNTNSRKFHAADCPLAADISAKNREIFIGSREELIRRGFSPCKNCNP